MSIVEGFGGMRVKDNTLTFEPKIPEQWDGYSFKVNFRNQILKVIVQQDKTLFELDGTTHLDIVVNGEKVTISPNNMVTI